ncbi:zinc finger protein 292b [Brachyhypopomus gauderio]|uniref:zinc finger protein 292b n=1 Tax=Brachyhypopomus gauderio TaxID=698409 RepID=UPI004041C5BA
MADEEAERDSCGHSGSFFEIQALSARLEKLAAALNDSPEHSEDPGSQYCQAFCQTLVEYMGRWRSEEDPWPMLEGYAVALLSYARASNHLSTQCDDVSVVLERVSLNCMELLLSISATFPDALWRQFQSSVQKAHSLLEENGITQLRLLSSAALEKGMWTDSTLQGILSNEMPPDENVCEFLSREGPDLLQLRVKYLIKENYMDKAAVLARACVDCPGFEGRGGHFRQIYLVCLCTVAPQQTLMDELSKVDCRDALEMICNLEAEGDERGAFTLCSGFLSRQLLQEDSYCAWELTLFWSKLLKRLEPSEQGFLERCRQMSRLAKTVFHLLFFIKVIQSELDKIGLPTCIEMCVRALRMESCEGASKTTMCKTISCLLPSDLEVKRACQLTEFLLAPTVDSYYAVETLYNEPDQKLEEESLPVPNSLRCELLLVFKTQWPFDPEFWDWRTLKRHCLGLMGEEASIVSSIDELNDDRPEETEQDDSGFVQETFKDVSEYFLDATNGLKEIADQRQKNREIKKLREKGFVSARFRNWQAYMQYCVLCDKEFLGHRIVRHAQTHFKDGYYSCPICAETFETRENLDPHVASHVKVSCKERLTAMKTTKKLANAKNAASVVATLKAKSGENQARKTKAKNTCSGDSDGMKRESGAPHAELTGMVVDETQSNICPVPNCRKRFKYFRNLLAHVKDHGEVEEAQRFLELQTTRIVCQYCRRQFVSVSHLNDHLQVHCGTKPYICIQLNCKASFDSNAELLVHRKDHPVFKAKCMFPGCGKIFSEAFKLYDHEAQHYKTFTCRDPGCGKVFHSQSQLDLHRESHDAKKTQEEMPEDHVMESQPDESCEPSKEAVLEDTLSGASNHPPALVKVKHSVESMLNTSDPGCTRAFDPGTLKTEPPDPSPIQPLIPMESRVIQPPVNPSMTHLNEPRTEDSLLDALMSDTMLVTQTPSYQSILEDFPQVPSREVLQDQMQTAVSQTHNAPLYSNANTEYGRYSPNSVAQIQAQYQDPYGNNMEPLPLSVHKGTPVVPVSQRRPPPPFSSNGHVSVSTHGQSMHTNNLPPDMNRPVHLLNTNSLTPDVSRPVQSMHANSLTPDVSRPVQLMRANSLTPDVSRPVQSMHANMTRDFCRPVQSMHANSLTPDINRPVQSMHANSLTPDVNRPVQSMHANSLTPDVNRPVQSMHANSLTPDINRPVQSMHTNSVTPDISRPVQSMHTNSLTPDVNRPVQSMHANSLIPDVNRPVQSMHANSLTPDVNRPVQSMHANSLTPDVNRPVQSMHANSLTPDVNRPVQSMHANSLTPDVNRPVQSMHANSLTPDMNRPVQPMHANSLTQDVNRPVQSMHANSLTPDVSRPIQSMHTSSLTPDVSSPVQAMQANSLGPAAEEKHRHKCAYETCSRDYSSYRSLTKHMKAAHPEFYTQWKLTRKNNREVQSTSRTAPMNAKVNSVAPLQKQTGQRISVPVTQIQNPASQPASSASGPSSSCSSASSHLASTAGQTFPNQMENILDPIVLSQLGNSSSQSHRPPESSWTSAPVNSSLQQQACHSQGITSNMDALSAGQFSSHVNAGSQNQRPDAQCVGMVYPPLQTQSNYPCHFIPSQMEGSHSMNNPSIPGHSSDSPASPYTHHPKKNSVHVVKHTECVVKLERNPHLGLPRPNSSQQNTPPTGVNSQSSQDDAGSSKHGGDIKRVKRNKRTKWPAIVRDGKFICCRCFREFQSPKSLGGHLSKRSHCKAFDEADLTADLPTSFLDLLNSPHPVNTPQDTNQTFHSVNKALDPKLFPNVTFLHREDSTYSNDSKQSGEIKQNPANPCEPLQVGQQTVSNTTLSHPQDGQNGLIKHEHGNERSNPHQIKYTQSCNPLPNDTAMSDPLLSHLLDEDNVSASFNKLPTDHVGKILQAETLNKMKEMRQHSTTVNTSGLSNDGLLAAMASLAQNLVSEKSVKEKLREQILAGDFHKKNNACQGQGVDHSVLQSTISSSSIMDPQLISQGVQNIPQSDKHHAGNSAELSTEGLAQTGSVAPNEGTDHIPVAVDVNANESLPQRDEMAEIQKALERLVLDKEIVQSDQVTTELSESDGVSVASEVLTSAVGTPGYSCDNNGCGYRAMTKDALFKHLIKLHNYTDDMLNQWRKERFKYAPFSCQVCSKTFTRNSNLRAHYQTVHNYSQEQMVNTRIKRHYSRRSLEGDGNSPCPTPGISDSHFLDDRLVQKTKRRQHQHLDGTAAPVLKNVDKSVKSECSILPFAQQPPPGTLNTSQPGTVQTAQITPSQSQAAIQPPSLETASNMKQQLNGQLGPRPLAPSQHSYGTSLGGLLPPGTPVVAQPPSITAQAGSTSPDKKPKLGRPKMPKPKEMPKKAKDKKVEMDDVFSPYRPYRCVHQGCVAAFTIQHNLILHYKAVHQSDLPKFEVDNEEEQNEEEENENEEHDVFDAEDAEVTELRCQVKDCSRVFQVVTDLLQHYLQLHKLSLDEAGALLSQVDLGRFQCDQPDCAVTFTDFWKYVSHIDKEHKDTKILRVEPVDGMFRCEVEGCDCVYSTRSNLLRHTMKKHQDLYKHQLMNSKEYEKGMKLGRPRKNNYACLEKENREVNKKPIYKGGDKKRKDEKNHWTKYGKPILKTTEEASALCTKKFPLQYPCMIKGCETVTSSERNIMKHYVQHGLPKQYLEEQRSNYIYCKKLPRSRYKRIASRSDDTDESSIEMSENEEALDTGPSESEFSKPTSEKESTGDAEGSDVKPSTDTGSDVSVVIKRRRGRPRKGDYDRPFAHKRMTRLRAAQSYAVNYADINSDSTSSSTTLTQEDGTDQNASLSSFKPLGFEVSFLQFLEESSQSTGKRKASVMLDVHPRKRTSAMHLKTASVVCSRSDAGDILKLVEFKNPQKLTCLSNVTFEVHRGFSNVFELLLKQLHEMRPAVVIQKRGSV